MEPSPTAEATRLTEPLRTSLTANTPGKLISSKKGSRPTFRYVPRSASRLRPVSTNPLRSSSSVPSTIATRYLLRTRQRAAEASVRGAEPFAEWLDTHLADTGYGPAEATELKLLGDVLGLSDHEGAEICEVIRATFRQRLSRARGTIRFIIAKRCGLIDASNPCSCNRQIDACIRQGILDPQHPVFAALPRANQAPLARFECAANQLDEMERFAALVGSDDFSAPASVWAHVRLHTPDLVN